jgi:hypothetical protein
MKNVIFTSVILIVLVVIIYLFTGNKEQEGSQPEQRQGVTKLDDFADSVINLPLEAKDTIQTPVVVKEEKTQIKDTFVKKSNKKVIVHYFHPTTRCVTCTNIENYSREVVETKFSKEQKNKQVFFRSVNIEDSINEHYIEDFNLTSSSLVVVLYEGKRRKYWKNLEKVWLLEKEKDKFSTYVKIELQQFLKNLTEKES